MNDLTPQTLADLSAYLKRVLSAPAIPPAGPITEIQWHGDAFTALDTQGRTVLIGHRDIYDLLKQTQFLP